MDEKGIVSLPIRGLATGLLLTACCLPVGGAAASDLTSRLFPAENPRQQNNTNEHGATAAQKTATPALLKPNGLQQLLFAPKKASPAQIDATLAAARVEPIQSFVSDDDSQQPVTQAAEVETAINQAEADGVKRDLQSLLRQATHTAAAPPRIDLRQQQNDTPRRGKPSPLPERPLDPILSALATPQPKPNLSWTAPTRRNGPNSNQRLSVGWDAAALPGSTTAFSHTSAIAREIAGRDTTALGIHEQETHQQEAPTKQTEPLVRAAHHEPGPVLAPPLSASLLPARRELRLAQSGSRSEIIAAPQAIQKAAQGPQLGSGSKTAPPPASRVPNADALQRPLEAVGIETAPPATLLGQLAKAPESFQIKNHAKDEFGDWRGPAEEISQRPVRYPLGSVVSWAAPSVGHRPLYFEQPNLERYGHQYYFGKQHGYGLPSLISAAHFFGSIPALPYLVGAEGATCERHYGLGSYRPGSCNPHRAVLPPLSLRGALFEGAAATGLSFFIP